MWDFFKCGLGQVYEKEQLEEESGGGSASNQSNGAMGLDLDETIVDTSLRLCNNFPNKNNGTTRKPSEENKEYEPFVGQRFLCEEDAYTFYKNYAIRNGFSIRKGRFINKDGKIRRRDFFCHRHGRPPLKVIDPTKVQRNRISMKSECNAHLRISLKKVSDSGTPSEQWHVTAFVADHNHDLLTPEHRTSC